MPPRRPIWRHGRPCSTTWIPWRASQALLVEAVFRWTGRFDLRDRLDHGALRRRSAERELQERRLVDRGRSPNSRTFTITRSSNSPWRAGAVTSATVRSTWPIRSRGSFGRARPAETRPRPTRRRPERSRAQRDAPCLRGRGGERCRDEARRGPETPAGARGSHAASPAHSAAASRCGRARSKRRDHGATRSRSCSRRAGPIPGIASRSSTEVNAPWRLAPVEDLLRRDRARLRAACRAARAWPC